MRARHVAAILLALLVAPPLCLARGIPQQAQKYIKSRYPNYEIIAEAHAEGDINGDGISDAAFLIISHPRENHVRLVILEGKPDGGFSQLVISRNWSQPQHGVDFDIRKRSIFVQTFHGDQFEGYFYRYQFQYKDNRLVLIGEDSGSELSSEEARSPSRKTSISTNYLTGDVIKGITEKGKTIKTKSRLPVQQLMTLEEFEM